MNINKIVEHKKLVKKIFQEVINPGNCLWFMKDYQIIYLK